MSGSDKVRIKTVLATLNFVSEEVSAMDVSIVASRATMYLQRQKVKKTTIEYDWVTETFYAAASS